MLALNNCAHYLTCSLPVKTTFREQQVYGPGVTALKDWADGLPGLPDIP